MFDNNYEKEYLNWFCYDATNEEVESEINAIIDREKNIETLEIILKKLSDEIYEIDELISESKEEFEEERKMLISKKEIFSNQIEEYNNKRQKEKYLEEFGASGVLFAINSYGNIMIEKDLKSIKNNCEESVYQSFIKLIKLLIENKKSFRDTEQKPVQSDSDSLKGIYELKDFQARLLYRYIGDYIVIIGATIKKTTLDNKYRKFCVNCKERSDGFVLNIEKGNINIDDLTEESTKFFESITNNGIGGLI